ncbi:50S ribosomal protein L23 [Candidatus Uhrbacteria bacterium]|nr:50S ribosomal protein L23 [Candidatus Uhrbacteria bacterium]
MGLFNKKKKDIDEKEVKEASTDFVLKEKEEEKKQAEASEEKAAFQMKKMASRKYNVKEYAALLRPIITEKSVVSGTYLFEVAKNVNKIDIKKAFYNIYGIMPKKVNVVVQQGKQVRYGRVAGKRKDWKKAIVILKKGEKIDTY